MRFEVVCFDLWNTLIHEAFPGALVAARTEYMHEHLAAHGVVAPVDELKHAHATAQNVFEQAWGQNAQFHFTDASRLMAATLGLDDRMIPVLDDGFRIGSEHADVRVVHGAHEVVRAAIDSGARIALICDVGLTPSSTLRCMLSSRQLDKAFDVLLFSDEHGVYKPSPSAFHYVLDELGCTSVTRAVHIGDRRRTDVAGAKAAGLLSVRFSGVFDDLDDRYPEADVVAATLADVARVFAAAE